MSRLIGSLQGAFNYRHFIISSIISENKSKFVHSKLGWLWMIINPLAYAAVLALLPVSLLRNVLLPTLGNP
mgnify:CR=1 FL=1